MAEASKTPKETNPVPHGGDHDRVAMLSVKADGTLDQHQPEVIIDEDAAVAATQRQFAEQAVSAVDVAQGAAVPDPRKVTLVGQDDGTVTAEPLRVEDPSIAEAAAEQQKAADAAAKAAAAAVKALSK